ncbi:MULTISPECIES: helix-turn-helix domain-containing protein [unclassified Streptomyces]|uniref:helix-turn-helix domain-containing protein n=1 Tax=unclassified Streptomyces TaxID=2593676 RepID=UPI0037FBC66A
MPEPHERLNEAMNQRRLALRMNWRELAQAAGISYEALRAIRRGDYRPTELTSRGLDEALRWEHGSVFSVLNGGTPTLAGATATSEGGPFAARDLGSAPEQQPTLSSRELDILQDLIEMTAARLNLSPEEADEAYRRARLKIEEQRAAEGRNDPPTAPRSSRSAS